MLAVLSLVKLSGAILSNFSFFFIVYVCTIYILNKIKLILIGLFICREWRSICLHTFSLTNCIYWSLQLNKSECRTAFGVELQTKGREELKLNTVVSVQPQASM